MGLDDLNSREFAPALKAWFLQTCRQYGFNTVGVHTELSIVNNPQSSMPYMQPIHFVDIPHWKPEISDSNFKDVFSEEFTAHCDGMAKKLVTLVNDYTQLGDGFLTAKTDALNKRIKDYEAQILNIEDTAAALEDRLRKQFTSLEKTLIGLQAQQSYLFQALGG